MGVEKQHEGTRLVEFAVGSSRFLMAPEEGFRLMKWTVATARGQREVLHWPADTGNQPLARIKGGNPLLFPFAGRSYDRGVENAWRPQGRGRLPMPRHGFARSGRFTVTAHSDNQIAGVLEPAPEALEAYPFEHVFSAHYTFEELALKVTLSLENRGGEPIPWSAGHHFYFTLPWHKGAARRDYRLNMEARKCAYHGPDGKLVPQQDRQSCHDLGDTALLDRIHWQLRHNRVSFGPKGGEEDVHIVMGADPVPPKGYALLTWSESADAPYYCIEPWMGPPNAAEHGKGLHWVNPGETAAFTVEVSLF